MSGERVEVLATHLSELKEPLQEVTVSGKTVLFAKTSTSLRATSPKCPHYGAPLVKGVLSGDRVMCPWHGACFNTSTGDIEDYPSLDCLETFPVRVDGDDVFISLPGADNVPQQRHPVFTTREATSEHRVVIVGGGAAGVTAAETLRQNGFTGRITLLSGEKHLPYDRPKLYVFQFEC
jgi:nitrite reductase/ring-hydroxylating ferredoxin subunit